METFLVLLLIIFVPFVWFIRRMLRFTDETVGDDSLVFGLETSPNRTRTYQFSASDYFGTFLKGMYAFVFVQMLVVSLMLMQFVPEQEGILRLLLVAFILGFLAFALYIAYFFYVDWRFWTITRNVALTLDPYKPSITVEGPHGNFEVFTPDTLSHIEHYLIKIDNSKHPLHGYGCFCLYGTSGQTVWINNIFFSGFSSPEFLGRLFPHVPITIVWQKFPGTSMISQIENRQTAEL